MKPKRRLYTLLIVGPHGRLRKIQLPYFALHVGLAAGVVALTLMAALASSYARMLLKVANYNSVRDQHEALKTQYRSLEDAVTDTNAKLSSLESLASEVAMTYGFGRTTRPGFPQAVLALATESNSTLESSYNASLYAFNLMRTTALSPPADPVVRGLISTPAFDRSAIPSLWPVHGQITGGFGERLDPMSGEGEYHWGIDISARKGTDVEAPGDGVVIEAGRAPGYGKEIVLDHGNGITTKYGHLSEIDVVVGQAVREGQIIGAVGMTGKATGPHLHYEVLVHQTPVNPAKYLGG